MENIHALVGEIKKGVTFVFINFYQILASPFWMTRAKMLEVKNLENTTNIKVKILDKD